MSHLRALPFALALLIAACGGAGPDADAGKSDAELREQAAELDIAALEKVIEEYKEAIEEADLPQKAELGRRLAVYSEALAKKKQ